MKQAQVLRALFDRTIWSNYGYLLKPDNFDNEFGVVFTHIRKIFEKNPQKQLIITDDLLAISNGSVTSKVCNARIPADKEMTLNAVKEFAQNACIIDMITKIAEKYQDGEAIDSDKLQVELSDINRKFSSIGTGLYLSHTPFTDLYSPNIGVKVLPMPVEELTERLDGGPAAGELMTVVAPPDGGKSMFLINCARHAAEQGKLVLYFTMETTRNQFALRYNCSCAFRKESTLLDKVTKRVRPKMALWFEKYNAWLQEIGGEIVFYDSSDKETTVPDIARAAERVISDKGRLDGIIIDYGDLVHSSRRYQASRDEQKMVWKEFCRLGKHLEIPIITASQINREGAKADRIGIGHVAETWAKATDSQIVLLVERTERDISRHTATLRLLKTKKSGGYANMNCVFDTVRCRVE